MGKSRYSLRLVLGSATAAVEKWQGTRECNFDSIILLQQTGAVAYDEQSHNPLYGNTSTVQVLLHSFSSEAILNNAQDPSTHCLCWLGQGASKTSPPLKFR